VRIVHVLDCCDGTNYEICSPASLGAGAASVTQLVTTGASANLFGIFNSAGSGPPGSSPSPSPSPSPSRFLVDVNGTLVPAPGALLSSESLAWSVDVVVAHKSARPA
jgi:hypothetical protein